MKIIAITVALCAIFMQFSLIESSYGFDTSTFIDVNQFKCLLQKNASFSIFRAFRSNGEPDYNAPKTINNAIQAGFTEIDVYMFPCPKCGNPQKQVQLMLDLQLNVKMIWIDVEIFDWSSDKNKSRSFLEEIILAIKLHDYQIGIYTSYNNWKNIMGLDYTKQSSLPLWYAHYDNKPTFDDFQPFGGWQRPTVKQYAENEERCDVSVDLNFIPDHITS